VPTTTRIAELLGIRHPIIQGPFGGGLSSIALVAAVSEAGGLGSFGVHHLEPEAILQLARDIRKATDKPFALNLWVSDHDEGGLVVTPEAFERALAPLRPYFAELGVPVPECPGPAASKFAAQMDAVLEAAPPVFSFVYGVPDRDTLRACRRRGIVTVGTATTPDEAAALEAAGIDAVVATGFEAGGHRVSFLRSAEESLMGTMSLVPQVVDRVRIPVIAAGGIADARGVRAALALGAGAAQVGTAFLACAESNASPAHRAALFTPAAHRTELTRVFTGRLARGIRNRLVAEVSEHLPYPAQSWLVGTFRQAAMAQGRADLMSLWAGQSASLLQHRTAGELMKSLVTGL